MGDSRSLSPYSRRRERHRSRSPRRRDDGNRPKKSSGGFRWKEKKRDDDELDRDNSRLDHGYREKDRGRDRDSYRASDRERDGGRDREEDRERERRRKQDEDDREEDKERERRRKQEEDDREEDKERERRRKQEEDDRRGKPRSPEVDRAMEDKFGPSWKDVPSAKPIEETIEKPRKEKKERREKKEKKIAPTTEPMIIVNVNDRLGTKASIPCLASDPIGLFKAQVAARIGRKPHEIMLKRQGERPMKDQLTLEDYGVSNGVQLDLELDTGD